MKDKTILSKENIETLAELVKPYLTEKRYEHTLSVKREAERLGEIFLPDEVNRLAASALLHDITKKTVAILQRIWYNYRKRRIIFTRRISRDNGS